MSPANSAAITFNGPGPLVGARGRRYESLIVSGGTFSIPWLEMSRNLQFAARVSAVRGVFRGVLARSQVQWMEELANHADPEQELLKWETVAFAYAAFFEARTPSAKAKDQAVRVLLDCTAGASEAQIHQEAYKSLSIAEIKSLIEHYHAAAVTVREIQQLKRSK